MTRALEKCIENGWFEENTIFHQHFHPSDLLCELVESLQAHVVTGLRNPYDAFVSLCYFVQNFPNKFGTDHILHQISGKQNDHPDVLNFIGRVQKGFSIHIILAQEWLTSGRTIIIRYEQLRTNPFKEIMKVAAQIAPMEDTSIRKAIQACSAQNMRKQSRAMLKHIRKASVEDWRSHLTKAHLGIFRIRHKDLIEKMGYTVEK